MAVTRKTPKTRKAAAPTAVQIQAKADRAEGIADAPDVAIKTSKEEIARDLDEARRLFEEAQARAVAAGVSSPMVHIEKTSSDSVWIGCKLPNGLLLSLFEKTMVDRPVMGGAGIKPTPVYMRTGEPVRLKGAAVPFGVLPRFSIEEGYSLTQVKRAFWETWFEQNKKSDIVINGLVFCQSDKNDAEAEAREKGVSIKSGLEPLTGPDDYRVDKMRSPNLSDLDIDSDRNVFKHLAI